MKNRDFKDSRLLEAFDYIDRKYIAEVADSLKFDKAAPMPAKGFDRRTWRHIIALAACMLLLGAIIPVLSYVIRNFTDFSAWFPKDTTEESYPLTEPETPPEETTTLPPETTEEETTAEETTSEETTVEETTSEETTSEETTEEETTEETTAEETTSIPEPEYDGSRGLEYKISDDGTYAMLVGKGTCTDNDIVVATTYNGVPVTTIYDRAFGSDANITSIHISANINNIAPYAFVVNSLRSITVDAGNPVYQVVGNCLIDVKEKNLVLGCATSVIPSDGSVVTIYPYAFARIKGLTAIVIPDSVEHISSYAFENCYDLMSVTMSKNLKTIGLGTFMNCSNLETIDLGDIEIIQEYAFRGCTSLKSVTGTENLTKIYPCAFESCTSLASFTFGSRLTLIDSLAFKNCTILKSIDIPASVTEIGQETFNGCTSLESVTIRGKVDMLYAGVFSHCSSLKNINIAGVRAISNYAFEYCTALERISLPESLEKLGEGAFNGCTALTDLQFAGTVAEWNAIEKKNGWNEGCPFTVVHCSDGDVNLLGYDGSRGLAYYIIGDYAVLDGIGTCTDTDIVVGTYYKGYPVRHIDQAAFLNNTGIRSIKLSDTVTQIGHRAFAGCTALESIYISASVNGIDEMAFYECPNITSISIDPNNKIYEGTNCIIEKEHKWLMLGCRTTVIPADGSVTYIGGYAFNKINGLYSITIPDGVIDIEMGAFSDCPDLRELHLPSTLRFIGTAEGNIIYGSNNIEVITIPKNSEYFYVDGNCLIERKTGVLALGCKTSVIPTDGTVKEIGRGAFQGNPNIKNIVLPEGITKIDQCAFAGCKNLKSIVFPKSLTEIGPWAFQNCTSLEKINLAEKVTVIYYEAFHNCTNLKEVVLPNSLEKIYWSSFGLCPALNEIKFLGTKAEWNSVDTDNSWNTGSAITVIHCSDGDINLRAHDGSQGLVYKFSADGTYAILVGIGSGTDEKIVVATTYNGVHVKKIGSHAFAGNASLTEIVIPEGVTVIGDEAFYVCGNLQKVTLPSTLESIQDMAFMGCKSLERITIPDSVTNIGQNAFNGCENLTSLTLGKGVELIEENAFKNCSSLDYVRFPKSLRLIAADAFAGCSSLASIYYAGTIAEWNSVDSTGRDYGNTYVWYEGVPAAKISCTNGDIFIAPITQTEAYEAAREFLGIPKDQIGGKYLFAAKAKDPSHLDCYRVALCEYVPDIGYLGEYEVLREVYVNQNTGECTEIVFDYPDIPEVFLDVIFNRETFTFVDKEYSSSGYTYKTEECYLKTFELLPTCLFGAESQSYALLDIDGDSVPELIFSYSSSTYYGLILRYYEGKVYGYSFGGDGLMTDCTNSWHEGAGDVRGLDKLYFDGLYLKSRELLRYDSADPDNVKYYVEGKETTKAEYEKFAAQYDGEYLKYTTLDLYPVYVNPFPGG